MYVFVDIYGDNDTKKVKSKRGVAGKRYFKI